MTITRVPLREQVHRAVVGRILREELAPGSRISDSVMAAELGVSRTPVREALLRLEREGFLEVDMGRGFFVKPLSATEMREVYPILWTLEVLALRSLPPVPAPVVAELDRINAEMAEVGDDPERRIDLDTAWHRTLLEGCGNQRLVEMIASVKAVVRRYEYAYMQNSGFIPVSTRTHDDIARAVERGDLESAAPLLESNWRFGMEEMLEWLESGR
ncbi:GntR family transcriptional regulator [Longimicrobium sp.]|uniref:GntR family transcriptional regulator n=1 Tax=Longimicrobium sp. TaxID=2029185 RepID=UPI002CA18D28|nr:GntR family transcriptional regulator [Longimicrobium sp.]HSU13881.1 GntR family transcriptional regulator [Longimicrobium sp.]